MEDSFMQRGVGFAGAAVGERGSLPIGRYAKNILVVVAALSIIFTATTLVFFFSHYPQISELLQVAALIRSEALEPVTTREMLHGATKGIVAALEDPYSTYLEPQEYKSLSEHISGAYTGVGLLIELDPDRGIVVVTPFKGGPAYRAGMKSGDIILQIDGRSTLGMRLEEAAALIQGQPGTRVRLAVQREGGPVQEIELVREEIKIPSVEGQMLDPASGTGYIGITSFNANTASDLADKLAELEKAGMRKLVLDLRNNPGGDLMSSVQVASQFISGGPVVYTVSRAGTRAFEAEGEATDVPLVVLVNGGTASAAEIVAGALQDTGRAKLVGEKTFGKGLVQKLFLLDNGAALKLTTEKYLTPKKRDINKHGIEPDIVVEPAPGEKPAGFGQVDPDQDAQLRRALAELEKTG